MNTMTNFVKVRGHLEALASQAIGPTLIMALLEVLLDLKALREQWLGFKPKSNVPAPKPIEILPPEVSEVELPPIIEEIFRLPPRRVPTSTSTSYSAELILPYRILWAKVIVRAAYDYALWKSSPDIRLRRFAEDAARWIFETSEQNLELSFENICAAFDFPVEKIREKTRTLTREDVKKLEFRERQGRTELLGEVSDGRGR